VLVETVEHGKDTGRYPDIELSFLRISGLGSLPIQEARYVACGLNDETGKLEGIMQGSLLLRQNAP
jgi:hypothetical protein